MSILKVTWKLLFGGAKGSTDAERLENFYSPQADSYDRTRGLMLQRRKELVDKIEIPSGGILVELGAGTGENLVQLGTAKIKQLSQIHLVDLTQCMLDVASTKVSDNEWDNVEIHHSDANQFVPPSPADVVLCSYTLSMIPDWFATIDNAFKMLKPGGVIAVVDFYVSQANPPEGFVKHSLLGRTLVPKLFARNGVRPNSELVPHLLHRFETVDFSEHIAAVIGKSIGMPYFLFIGRKRQCDQA